MLFTFLLLVPVAALAAWLFFRSSPKGAAVRRYNAVAVTVVLLAALGWGAWIRRALAGTVDYAWWPPLAVLGALALVATGLLLAGWLRNRVLFRSRDAVD